MWQYNYDANGNMIERGKNGTWNSEAGWILNTGSAGGSTGSGGSAKSGAFEWAADSGEIWQYGYDLSNRLVSVQKGKAGKTSLENAASYTYDSRGLRIASVHNDGTTYYEYDTNGNVIWREVAAQAGAVPEGTSSAGSAGSAGAGDDWSASRYLYANGGIWAEERITTAASGGSAGGSGSTGATLTEVFYHHVDHLGTTEVITDNTGAVVWNANYDVYGAVVSKNGTETFTPSFTGKQLDDVTGLYYFNARWYDSSLGRFITEDPARDGGNWYAYCSNNPLKFVDPTGLLSEEHEYVLKTLHSGGASKEEIAEARTDFVDLEVQRIQKLQLHVDEASKSEGILSDEQRQATKLLPQARDDLLHNIQKTDYDQANETVDKILNNKLADAALRTVGTPYIWKGKPDNNKGGLDCSGVAEYAIEKASGILMRTRSANGMATDQKLMKPGDGSRGTLNFYNWSYPIPNNIFDHVTTSLGKGLMVHPAGNESNETLQNPGSIIIRGAFNTIPVNRQVNWRYMLFE